MTFLTHPFLMIAAAIGILFSGFSSISSQAADTTYQVEKTDGIEFAAPDGVTLLLDLHIPKGVENPPLVMFIHGGGWKGVSEEEKKLVLDFLQRILRTPSGDK